MNALEVFADDEMAALSQRASLCLVKVLGGVPCMVGLAGLFSAFVAVAIQAGTDPGVEFERMIAYYEDRKQATHRAISKVH